MKSAMDELLVIYEASYLADGKSEEDARLLASMQASWSLQVAYALPEERDYQQVINTVVDMFHEAVDAYLEDEFDVIRLGREIRIALQLKSDLELQITYDTRDDKVKESFFVINENMSDDKLEPPMEVDRDQLTFIAPEIKPAVLQNMTILALEMACDRVFG